MRISRIRVGNHSKLDDLELEVRQRGPRPLTPAFQP
jgi:hypothetical protein